MEVSLKEIIGLVKEIPEEYLKETLEKLKEIKEKADEQKKEEEQKCAECKSEKIVRNGKHKGKQAYVCRECKKSFLETSKSGIAYSHSSKTVWKQIIRDTINGVSIDDTAASLDLHHETVFNMRHKILYSIEQTIKENPLRLSGVCETDETYVLESIKGTKIPENYHRKSRKHGSTASKPGISNEYICVCSSVTSEGGNLAVSVNRASPSSQEILDVFGDRIDESTVILCDGKQSYNILDDKCTVATTKRVNKVNGFHSFIKEKLDSMRGVATTYLNRYNALFSMIYSADNSVVDDIFELMTSRNNSFNSIKHTQSENLLDI